MNLRVERYAPDMAEVWNAFVAASRNGTFLLDRGYMDYHADRFRDHSLMLCDRQDRILALLPANEHEHEHELHSHGGLTYGGLILGAGAGASLVGEMLGAIRHYLSAHSLAGLHYKTIPWIYHRQPAEEDRYAMFRANAVLTRRDVLSVVAMDSRLPYQNRRVRGMKAARKTGVNVRESNDYDGFWQILEHNLMTRHGTSPVHGLAEIKLLKARFPDAIRLFGAFREDKLVAGVLVYESQRVAHVQYISASPEGRDTHALDLLFDVLLTQTFATKPYFDFGISNEEHGRVLNHGLIEQKEGFGARSIVHDYYYVTA